MPVKAKKAVKPKAHTVRNKSSSGPVKRKSKSEMVKAEAPYSLRKLAKLETRRKLIAAARKLFVERGYHETRPQDIAKEAGVGYGTFYDNFEDKLDCYIAFTRDAHYELIKVIQWSWPADDTKTPEEFMHIMLHAMFDYSIANPGVLNEIMTDSKILSRSDRGGQIGIEDLITRLSKWRRAGIISADTDIELFANIISSIVKLGTGLVARNPDKQDEIVHGLTRFMVPALTGHKAKKTGKKVSYRRGR